MVVAFILVLSKTGREKEVLRALQGLDEIREASIVFGDYDIVAKVDVLGMDDLNGLLVSKIRQIPDVAATTTLIGI